MSARHQQTTIFVVLRNSPIISGEIREHLDMTNPSRRIKELRAGSVQIDTVRNRKKATYGARRMPRYELAKEVSK